MKYKLIFFSFFLTITVFGQSIAQGDIYFSKKQYAKARPVYEALLLKKPNDAFLNYRLAQCCYELKDFEASIEHFLLVGKKYPEKITFLGDAYFKTYRFDEALLLYKTYSTSLKVEDPNLPEIQQRILEVEKVAKLMTKVEDIAIVDSVVVNKSDFLQYYKFSSELGSLNQDLLKLNARQIIDIIKYTTQRKDRVYYSDSIQGQMDIFTSYKLLDDWSDKASVSSVINTPANENYPFLLLDGITLYFASDGENSIGGYDIFITRYAPSTDSFLAPENIGFPFNSPANDYMMVIDEQRKLGWFATDRNQAAGKVKIYTFVPNDNKIIIRTENNDSLRSFAQLRMYRKALKLLPESVISNEVQLQAVDKLIDFVINDSVVYNHLSQFKSENALKLWSEMEALSIELKNSKIQLDQLRKEYSSAETVEIRSPISLKIIALEMQNIEMENRLLKIKLQIRNAENVFLTK